MLHRKPRKGDIIENQSITDKSSEWKTLGVVTHCEGNICWYRYHRRDDFGCFIWWFESDKAFNKATRIAGVSHDDERTNRSEVVAP